MGWFKKERLSLDDALRQIIRGVADQDTDLAGVPMHNLSETDVDMIQVCLPEYKLSMAFNYVLGKTGLPEDELESRFESAGALAFQDLS